MDKSEIKDIVISWLAVSIAFGWVQKAAFPNLLFPQNFGFSLVVSMVAVGTGFVLHELAHRTLAIKFGAQARYIAWNFGLLLALLLAFGIGFVFAAPGAVYIFGKNISKKQNGLISLAGPAVNAALAVFFAAISLVFAKSALGTIAGVSAMINIWLAAFNLIPVFPLDGGKVFAWNKIIWAALFVPMVALLLFF